jgi:hypothetical protein
MQKLRAPTWQDFLLLIALLFLAFELVAGVVQYASVAGAAIRFPYPLDYGEGAVLDQTVKLAQGINPYHTDLNAPPYNVTNYPPLFQALQVPFALAGGPAFWYGRALSILSALAAAIFIALIVHQLTGDLLASAIAALLFFVFPHVALWSMFNRVDTLALALSLAALYAVVRWPEKRAGIIAAAVLFTASIFTKQSYLLAGPLAALVYLWQMKLLRQGGLLIGIIASASLVIAGLLTVLTQGGFILHTVTANANPWISYLAIDYFVNFTVNTPLLLVGVAMFILLERTGERTRAWPFVIAYLIAGALAGLAAGKVGSSVNYLYELVAAMCIAAGALVAWLASLPILRVIAVVALAAQVSGLREWTQEQYMGQVSAKLATEREIAQLNALAAQPEPMLADEFMGLLPINGKPIQIQPFEFNMLNIAGLWDENALIGRIERHEFKTIALYVPMRGSANLMMSRWPKTVRDAIYANYVMQDRLAENLIYVPKP